MDQSVDSTILSSTDHLPDSVRFHGQEAESESHLLGVQKGIHRRNSLH